MAGEDKIRVPKPDSEVKQEMLDKTKNVTYGSFDVRDASGMSMTPEQIHEEIRRCQKTKRNYELMNYMMAFYSGVLFLTFYSNLNHVKNDLKKSNFEYTRFYNLTATSWTFKPVFGWISDSFYPFRYRMKSYILFMTAIHCVFCVICYLNPDSYSNFFVCVFMIYFSVGFVDTLGEGMTAMITKMDQRIEELTPPEERKEKEAESKAIGFFFMFRLFIRTLSMFAGGSLSSRGYGIRLIYFILFFSPLSMFLYTLFVFKEARKNKMWNGCEEICKSLVQFFKVLFNPALLLVLIYNVALIAVPALGDVANFILLNKGGWTLEQISYITLTTGVLFAFFMIWFLGAVMPKMPFYLSYVIGGAGLVVGNMMMYAFLEPNQLGFWKMFGFYWIQTMLTNFTQNLPQLATIGRFTTYMPEGFESTGVTMLVSLMNMGVLSSGLLASVELQAFDVVAGYYERARTPMNINCWISFAVSALCPLFVAWRVKGLKKSHGTVENIEDDTNENTDTQAGNYKSMKTVEEESEQINADAY